jgi:hypothetical protein
VSVRTSSESYLTRDFRSALLLWSILKRLIVTSLLLNWLTIFFDVLLWMMSGVSLSPFAEQQSTTVTRDLSLPFAPIVTDFLPFLIQRFVGWHIKINWSFILSSINGIQQTTNTSFTLAHINITITLSIKAYRALRTNHVPELLAISGAV